MPPPPTASLGNDTLRCDPRVIGSVGLICGIVLLFCYYKILDRSCAKFGLSQNSDRRRCLDEHIDEFSSQFQSRGLNSYIMNSLPISQIKKDKDEESHPNSAECAVCLGEFEVRERVKHLPNCSHVFHISCIDMWFQTHSSCPLCRCHAFDIISTAHESSMSRQSFLV